MKPEREVAASFNKELLRTYLPKSAPDEIRSAHLTPRLGIVAACGVALAFVPHLPKTGVQGATPMARAQGSHPTQRPLQMERTVVELVS